MKKCPKCGTDYSPSLAKCPKCKTAFYAPTAGKSAGHQQPAGTYPEMPSTSPIRTRTIVMVSLLVVFVLILAAVLFLKREQLINVSTNREPVSPQETARPRNFNELLGTWSGREINRNAGWKINFSDGYNVSASGPEGWYRGKAAIHWELGVEKDGLRVPPGASVLDIDIEASSTGEYAGKTSLGAFSISGGTTLKLCSGEPGKTKRPEAFDPASGIRCFEFMKTAEATLPPAALQQEPQSHTDVPPVQMHAPPEHEVAEAREAFKKCTAAYKSRNMDEVKKYMSSTGLGEMESSGMLDMALGMMSDLNIDEFTPALDGNHMVFRKSQKQGDMSMSMTITMVKEDGKWKLGK